MARIARRRSVPKNGHSVDLVVCHCREDLEWLNQAMMNWPVATQSRLFLYEKCGERGRVFGASVEHVFVDDVGPSGRKDECSAYLTHLINAAWQQEAAEYTLFMQARGAHGVGRMLR